MMEQLIKSASGLNSNETTLATSWGVVVLFMGFRLFVFSTHSSHLSVILVNALVGVTPA
jgi:hypothetical protein